MVSPNDTGPQQPTAALLSATSPYDKTSFIKSFIQTQARHAQTYADNGRVYVASWRDEAPPTPTKGPFDLSLDTPILKPRVPKSQVTTTLPVPSRHLKSAPVVGLDTKLHKPRVHKSPIKKSDPEENARKENRVRSDKSRAKTPEQPVRPASKHGDVKSKKRCSPADEEEEHAARLTDRRERKRAKRAIAQPCEEDEHFVGDDGHIAVKTKKTKPNAALALMHGFKPANVGKWRLTVQPPTVGVFHKGKASAKTEKKPQRKNQSPFSEFEFLNKPAQKRGKRTLPETPVLDGSSVEAHPPNPVKRAAANRSPKRPSSAVEEESSSSPAKPSPSCDKRPAPSQSEIWDIESKHPTKYGTVVLDTRAVAWGGAAQEAVEEMVEEDQDVSFASFSSLSPHQSASQIIPQSGSAPGGRAPRPAKSAIASQPGTEVMAKPISSPSSIAPRQSLSRICPRSTFVPIPPLPKPKHAATLLPKVQPVVAPQREKEIVAKPDSRTAEGKESKPEALSKYFARRPLVETPASPFPPCSVEELQHVAAHQSSPVEERELLKRARSAVGSAPGVESALSIVQLDIPTVDAPTELAFWKLDVQSDERPLALSLLSMNYVLPNAQAGVLREEDARQGEEDISLDSLDSADILSLMSFGVYDYALEREAVNSMVGSPPREYTGDEAHALFMEEDEAHHDYAADAHSIGNTEDYVMDDSHENNRSPQRFEEELGYEHEGPEENDQDQETYRHRPQEVVEFDSNEDSEYHRSPDLVADDKPAFEMDDEDSSEDSEEGSAGNAHQFSQGRILLGLLPRLKFGSHAQEDVKGFSWLPQKL